MESYLIGTLFEEEEKEQKQNFYNQIARDDKGHKRFHGAFTGGFEAGYKNTCGSKEGWVPTQFISSRNNRAKVKQQSILEFMDEEDLGKTIAGETLVTKTDFSDPLGIQSKEIVKNSLGTSFLGDIPNELIVQNQTSIGRNMFNQMKIKEKKEKQQSENYLKNFSGPFREENKNNYDPMISVKYKDNYFGVGFDVLNYTPYEGDEIFEEEFNSLLKLKNMNKSEKDIEIEKEKEKKKQRIHFSNFNQKGEVELDEEYSNYEINTEEIEILKGMHNKNTNLSNNIKIENYLSKYEILPVPLQSKVRLNSIVIPPDYDPYKKIKEYQKNKINHPNFTVKKIKRDLNPEQREFILGEKEDSIEIQQQTFKQNLTEDKKNKILNVKQFVKGSEQDMDGDHIENIFKNDKDKKQRYLNFCYEMEGKVVGGIPPANNMTHEQLQKEIKEFEEIYSMFKNFKKTMKECKQDKILNQIDELKKKIEEEKGKRNVERWIPDKLLCKRFGVPQPYQGKV